MSKRPDDDDEEGHKPYYPEHPGYVQGSDTSKAAAHSVNGKRSSQVEACKKLLAAREPKGLTSDELERITLWPHQTASAVLRKCVLDGYAYDSPARRTTRYGRKAVVRRVKPT